MAWVSTKGNINLERFMQNGKAAEKFLDWIKLEATFNMPKHLR